MIMAKDSNNNYVKIEDIKQQNSFNGISPIKFKSSGENLENYRIYGNTVDGESVGDRTGNLWDEIYEEDGRLHYVPIKVEDGEYTLSTTIPNAGAPGGAPAANIFLLAGNVKSGASTIGNGCWLDNPKTVQSIDGYVTIAYKATESFGEQCYPWNNDTMLNAGSTPLPYEPYGYKVPVTITNGTDTLTTPIYLPEQIRKVGDEAEYIDFGEQKQHRVRKNLLQNAATSRTINGVTFTVNEDGSVTCNGTASVTTWFVLNTSFDIYAPDGRIVSIGNNGSTSTFYMNISYIGNITSSYNYSKNIHQNVYVQLVIAAGYTCDNLTFYPMIRKADIEDDTYEPYIKNTELDVTLPALPTLSGINTLSVETNTKPSKIWGKLSDLRDILYVKDNLGNILFSKYHEIEGESPLIYKAKKADTLTDYRIYGAEGNVGNLRPSLVAATDFTNGYHVATDGTIGEHGKRVATLTPIDVSTINTIYVNSGINTLSNPVIIYSLFSDDTFIERALVNGIETVINTEGANKLYLSFGGESKVTTANLNNVYVMDNDKMYVIPVTVSNGTDTQTIPIYIPEQIRKVGDEAEYISYTDHKLHRVGAEDIDVDLPELPTLAGTNTLSVGTAVQPSKINIKGKIKGKIYGWHVDPDISNSSDAVTYLEDAREMFPASMGSSTFDYGSWENAFFMPKPCMLKSNGKVDYYLDPNDYTKKLDGTTSDIANPNYDGNAMMEWPKIWFKYVKGVKKGQGYFYVANYKADGNFHCWCNYDSEDNEIDHFYTAIYNGTSFANYNSSKTYVVNDFAIYNNKLYKCNTAIVTAESFDSTKWDIVSNTAPVINKMRSLSGIRLTNNNSNAQTDTTTEVTRATANNTTSAAEWYIETFSDRLLINGLLVLMGKSLNTQAVFGRGLDTGGQSAKEVYVTGALNDKGLFWGVTENGNSGVKIFGMENFWGCCWHRTAGLITNNHAVKLKLTYGTKDGSTVVGYNQTGNGYIDNGISPYSNGYVQKMSYNKYGFMPAVVTGESQSTYYADYHYQKTNYTGSIYALFGGNSGNNFRAGAFYLGLHAAPEAAYQDVAASLSCKPLLN